MDKNRQNLGKLGERLALKFLCQQGYKIVSTNFSCRFGEIDIIALQENTTVFIEVKTRSSCEFGMPEDSITPEKIKRLQRSAQFYITHCARSQEFFRFDVVSIVFGSIPQIQLIKNAF